MGKPDIEGIRKPWLQNTEAEATLWLAHIDRRTHEVQDVYKDNRFPLFEIAELLFNVFAYLNWLAHIYFREEQHVRESGHAKGKDMITFLHKVTEWPIEACEAFWYCVRNPVMHTGRSFLFADYDRKMSSGLKMKADLYPNLAFDPAQFQPDAFKPSVEQDGFLALPDPENPDWVMFWFYFPGVRRKLETTRDAVLENIRNADHDSVLGLRKVNRKALAFRVSGALG